MKIENSIISVDETLLAVLDKINTLDSQTLYVINENEKLIGVITDGDIRRGFLRGLTVEDSIKEFMFTDFNFLVENKIDFNQLRDFRSNLLKSVPIINNYGKIVNIIDFTKTKSFLPIDAVIMAGGRGSRLKPLTNKTPKPLLKIGGKEIISYNFDRLKSFGIINQNITVNYKSDQIVNFCENYDNDINFKIVKEDKFLGTAGSISLIENFDNDVVLLMNSDILTNIDFEDFYLQFFRQDADILVASCAYEVSIPFAVFECSDLKIISMKEKPTKTYFTNAGIYLIKKDILKYIPKGKFYNATDLMDKVITENKKLIHYPIRDYWLDIGRMSDFEKAEKDIGRINFG